MPYMYVDLEFENLADLFNLWKPVELYLEIVHAVSKENLLGSNFNRYWGPDFGEIHPHISVRLRLKNLEASRPKIIEKADQLVSSGRIRFYSKLKEWNEPEFVVRAHELATKCSIIMLDQLKKQERLVIELQRNRNEFLLHLLLEMLRKAGFKASIPWTYLRTEAPVELEDAASLLAQEFQGATEEIDSLPDFLERFLNAFFNCLGFSGFEGQFLDLSMKGRGWRDLADSRHTSRGAA